MGPIISIASATVGEAVRRKVLLVILLIGVVFLVIAPGLSVLSARSETTVLKALMLGIIQMTSAVIAIVLTVYMIPNEIERRTIYTILSKPVQRWQFLVGKYLGAVATLLLMMTLMSAILVTMYVVQRGPSSMADVPVLLKGPLMYFVQMSLLAAVAVFFSTFVSPLVNFFLSGGLFLLGSLFNSFFQKMQTDQSTPPVAKFIGTVVNTVLPNFGNYSIQNPIVNPNPTIINEGRYFFDVTLYGVIYIAILLILGMLIFDRREV